MALKTYFFFFQFAEEDYDAFCLAYMFTYRDFEMGTLGLAWTGDLKNAGGVCEKNGVSEFMCLFHIIGKCWLRHVTMNILYHRMLQVLYMKVLGRNQNYKCK